MCCGQVYFVHEAHTWHHARGLAVMRGPVCGCAIICRHCRAQSRLHHFGRSQHSFAKKKGNTGSTGIRTQIGGFRVHSDNQLHYGAGNCDQLSSIIKRGLRLTFLPIDTSRSSPLFLSAKRALACLHRPASARVSSKCLAHRGARTHDHKIKSLALCQLS